MDTMQMQDSKKWATRRHGLFKPALLLCFIVSVLLISTHAEGDSDQAQVSEQGFVQEGASVLHKKSGLKVPVGGAFISPTSARSAPGGRDILFFASNGPMSPGFKITMVIQEKETAAGPPIVQAAFDAEISTVMGNVKSHTMSVKAFGFSKNKPDVFSINDYTDDDFVGLILENGKRVVAHIAQETDIAWDRGPGYAEFYIIEMAEHLVKIRMNCLNKEGCKQGRRAITLLLFEIDWPPFPETAEFETDGKSLRHVDSKTVVPLRIADRTLINTATDDEGGMRFDFRQFAVTVEPYTPDMLSARELIDVAAADDEAEDAEVRRIGGGRVSLAGADGVSYVSERTVDGGDRRVRVTHKAYVAAGRRVKLEYWCPTTDGTEACTAAAAAREAFDEGFVWPQ